MRVVRLSVKSLREGEVISPSSSVCVLCVSIFVAVVYKEPPSFLLIGCTLRKSGSSQRNSGSIYNSIYYTHPSTIIAAPVKNKGTHKKNNILYLYIDIFFRRGGDLVFCFSFSLAVCLKARYYHFLSFYDKTSSVIDLVSLIINLCR